MSPTSQVVAPLTGYTVVDLSSGIAGGYCTKLLADGGAKVIKVESPEGDLLRRWSASGAHIPMGCDGALFSFLACSKESVVADPGCATDLDLVGRLLEKADAVVWSPGSRIAEHSEFTPCELRHAHPHLTVTSITPFGLEGPWRDRLATEFTLQAWSGGIIGLGRGSPDRAPVHIGGAVGEWLAGVYAAAGTLISHQRGSDVGELVDVSMLEASILCLTYYPVTFFDMLGRPSWKTMRSITTPAIASASDGLVCIACGTAQQWFDICAMVGHPEWIDDETLLVDRTGVAPVIDEWVAGHTVAEVLDLTRAFSVPSAPVGNGANLPQTDHLQVRGSFVRNPRDQFTQPNQPYCLQSTRPQPRPAPRLGEHTDTYRVRTPARVRVPARDDVANRLPFEGLRVLDMTSYWAGPSCTHVLAMLGAEVIHLESTSRLDGARVVARVPFTEAQWWEKSPIYSAMNTNKKSLTIDFQTESGRALLSQLIATCDVVIENYTPRVLEQIGFTYEAVKAIRPDAIMVRMPGFGLDGPWRDKPAFGHVIETAAGLAWLTGFPDQNPVEPYAMGDPNAGVHALVGLLMALEHRRRTGEGMLVEAPMIDAALNIAAEQVIEYSAYGALLQRVGNRGPGAAPQNLYRSAGIDEFGRADCWVAIAVANDEQWLALRTALGQPDWAMNDALTTIVGRRQHHDLIDEQLAAWCRQRTAGEIVERLWSADVPVARVVQPHRQRELPQLQFRRFFEEVHHPVNGACLHSTLPFRLSRGPDRIHRHYAPLLGEHNRELLSELGLSEQEIAALESAKVIGEIPQTVRPVLASVDPIKQGRVGP